MAWPFLGWVAPLQPGIVFMRRAVEPVTAKRLAITSICAARRIAYLALVPARKTIVCASDAVRAL
jgi:hypothetical protein